MDFCKDFSVLGQTRLSHVTGSCCMIMLLPTTQLSSSSSLQRKASLFFTTPLSHQIWHPQTKVKSNLEGRRFDTISDIQNVMRNNRILAGEFGRGIQKPYNLPVVYRTRRAVC